jgi:hypothetical protein
MTAAWDYPPGRYGPMFAEALESASPLTPLKSDSDRQVILFPKTAFLSGLRARRFRNSDSPEHFGMLGFLWEGRPQCRPTNLIIKRKEWDGTEAVPPKAHKTAKESRNELQYNEKRVNAGG